MQYEADRQAFKARIVRWNRFVAEYQKKVEEAKQDYANRMNQYQEAMKEYHARRLAFVDRAARHNAQIERERATYANGDSVGVARTMTRVLTNSELPDEFPDAVDIQFDKDQMCLQVIRVLPSIDEMPSVKGHRVMKKNEEIKEQPLSDAARKRLFDGVVYQMALRTIHELLRGDTAKQLRFVDLRCVVEGYDPATGHPGCLVLARICADRERVEKLMLENVDPETCYKDLGGKTNGRPCNLKPLEVLFDAKD